jgi:organic hydroperoxide reductase OsmC/OhrA
MQEDAQTTKTFDFQLKLLGNYRFEIDFGDFGKILTDEPAPLGEGDGPNPARLLAASAANCLAASLIFAIRKFHEDPGQVSAHASVNIKREGRYWRVVHIDVALQLGQTAEAIPHLQRALDQFENFCVVTQSIRQGIPVDVKVMDQQGAVLKPLP